MCLRNKPPPWDRDSKEEHVDNDADALFPNLEQDLTHTTAAKLMHTRGRQHCTEELWQPTTPVVSKRQQTITIYEPSMKQQFTTQSPHPQKAHVLTPKTGNSLDAHSTDMDAFIDSALIPASQTNAVITSPNQLYEFLD